MSAVVPGAGSGPASPAGAAAAEERRSRWRAWRSEHIHLAGDLTRTVALLESTARVEGDVARTLRAMASAEAGEATARRLRLAEEASQ
jgi:hypothetical protein